jgi:hypothetical protein
MQEVLLGRRVLIVLSMVVLLALAIGVVGAVSASPDEEKDDNKKEHAALTVLTKTREIKVVDLGPQGPSQGDIHAVNAPIYNESGKQRIGRLDLFSVLTDPADEPSEKAHMAEATATYTLPGGEISAQGVRAYPELSGLPARGVDAITGGTEKYAGVRGEVNVETRGTKVIITFHFIG